jgi:hypothetical protein
MYKQQTSLMNYKTRNLEFSVLHYGVLSSLLFLQVKNKMQDNKPFLCVLKSKFKNDQELKFWSCSVAIFITL